MMKIPPIHRSFRQLQEGSSLVKFRVKERDFGIPPSFPRDLFKGQ